MWPGISIGAGMGVTLNDIIEINNEKMKQFMIESIDKNTRETIKEAYKEGDK
jgi:hypothetical protein